MSPHVPCCMVLAEARTALAGALVVAPAMDGGKQSTGRVLMVRPEHFSFNEAAAEDNVFMEGGFKGLSVAEKAMQEFEGLVGVLRAAGVVVEVKDGGEGCPDAVFPNNWFSTHRGEAGSSLVMLYPMKAANRRAERANEDVTSLLCTAYGPQSFNATLLAQEETLGKALEGTGSLVLDRRNRKAFCCLSERSDASLAEAWKAALPYERMVTFRASDPNGRPVYHTNVLMAVGTQFAIVCLAAITDEAERRTVGEELACSGLTVVEISYAQVLNFCGNVLEVATAEGHGLVMSQRAKDAFTAGQLEQLREEGAVTSFIVAEFTTIERCGGGGVRCTIAELF